MRNKKLVTLMIAACMTAGLAAGCGAKSTGTTTAAETTAAESSAEETTTEAAETTEAAKAEDEAYEPVTITLNLERSGLGENVEYTFTKKPSAVVASGDQMADFFSTE